MENKQFQSKPIGLVGKKKRRKKGQILTKVFWVGSFFTTTSEKYATIKLDSISQKFRGKDKNMFETTTKFTVGARGVF